jgi:hypothetical protein
LILLQRIKDFCEEMVSVQLVGESSCIDVRDRIHRQNTMCAVAADPSQQQSKGLPQSRSPSRLAGGSGTARMQ